MTPAPETIRAGEHAKALPIVDEAQVVIDTALATLDEIVGLICEDRPKR